MKLSEQRVASVKKYLVVKFGIKASRISSVGYGESIPMDTNDTRKAGRKIAGSLPTSRQ